MQWPLRKSCNNNILLLDNKKTKIAIETFHIEIIVKSVQLPVRELIKLTVL